MVHDLPPLVVEGIPKRVTGDLDGIVGTVEKGCTALPEHTRLTFAEARARMGSGYILGVYTSDKPDSLLVVAPGEYFPACALGYLVWGIKGSTGSKLDANVTIRFPLNDAKDHGS